MNNVVKNWMKLSALMICLALAACGGGGGSAGTTTTSSAGTLGGLGPTKTVLAGRVADGYLEHAEVFLDLNQNRLRDAGEPWTKTDATGAFSLQVAAQDATQYPVVVAVVAGKTIDTDDGASPVANGYTLETPIGHSAFVSPLTTLVDQQLTENPGLSLPEAVVRVTSALGISGDVSLFDDYLAGNTSTTSAADSAEFARMHLSARVIAGLMGQVLTRLQNNLGGSFTADNYQAATLIAGDAVMNNMTKIVAALGAPGAATTPVATLVSDLLGSMNLPPLDQSRIALYEERLAQHLPVWDVTPPQITDRFPAGGQDAPVSTTVTVTFSEDLDASTVGANALQLQGPNGPIAGSVSYDAQKHQLSFTPDAPLQSLTTYAVTLSGTVADKAGNPIGQDVNWNFSTIFDATPPAPPAL